MMLLERESGLTVSMQETITVYRCSLRIGTETYVVFFGTEKEMNGYIRSCTAVFENRITELSIEHMEVSTTPSELARLLTDTFALGAENESSYW